jgi:hypothetical protein
MSPLLQPADCCVLLVDPRMGHVGRLGQVQQQAHTQALNLVVDVAAAGRAPIHVAYADVPPEAHDWLEGPRVVPTESVHALGAVGLRWSNSGLNAVLAARKRRSLVLGGFWLETTVTFLAIPALAHGFEVFILMDATPAQKSIASTPATNRLLNAGAVPITMHQLVAEWSEASPDPNVRSALSALTLPN